MKRRDFLNLGMTAGVVALFDPATGQAQELQLRDFLKWRFCSGQPALRRDAHGLLASNPQSPVFMAYAKAIEKMKTLPLSDPTGLAYQAAIHGYGGSQTPPPNAPFSTCNHGSGFLVWHRMYLYFYERIIRHHSGDPSFSLPYWNYSKAGQNTIPSAFRQTSGAFAPLFDDTRRAQLNSGGGMSAGVVATGAALARTDYSGFQSSLNGTPHGVVHTTVSGNMALFNTTGFDPLFWLHHCNIDRMWEVWLAQAGGRINPIDDAGWMTRTWTFADANGSLVSMAAQDALETISQMGYQYEEPRECIPLHIDLVLVKNLRPLRPFREFVLVRDIRLPPVPDPTPIMKLADARPSGGGDLIERKIEPDTQIELVFDGVHLEKPQAGYFEIYGQLVNADGQGLGQPVLLGNLNTFGMDMESMESMKRGGMSESDMTAAMSVRVPVTAKIEEMFKSVDSDSARLDLSIRAVSGLEKDDESIETLNEGVIVSVDAIRLEFLSPG